MKTRITAILLASFAVLTSSCEKHKWEETQKLFKGGEHAGPGVEHGKAGSHGGSKAGEAKH